MAPRNRECGLLSDDGGVHHVRSLRVLHVFQLYVRIFSYGHEHGFDGGRGDVYDGHGLCADGENFPSRVDVRLEQKS